MMKVTSKGKEYEYDYRNMKVREVIFQRLSKLQDQKTRKGQPHPTISDILQLLLDSYEEKT